MDGRTSYGQDLRAIGQAIEEKHISIFELKHIQECYLVRGEPDKGGSLLSSLRERLRGETRSSLLTYAAKNIERLDREGKAKRKKAGRLPDFYSLPNTLRTVGYYLDSNDACLLEIHKSPLNLMILYNNKDGHPNVEERAVASFYDLFIRLHGNRRRPNTI